MRIKVKVKHLLLTIIGVLLVIPLVLFVIHPQVELYVGKKQLEKGEAAGKEKLLQALEGPIFQQQKWDLIQTYMLNDGLGNRFDVYVGPSSTQVNNQTIETALSPEEKLPYLRKYVKEGPISGYLTTAAKQLAFYYQREGTLEKADEVLTQGVARFSKSRYTGNQEELQLERIRLFMMNADQLKAKELINELKKDLEPSNYHLRAELARLEAEMIVKEGNVEEAYQLIGRQIKEYEKQLEKEKQEFPDLQIEQPLALEQLESLQAHLETALEQNAAGVSTVKGKVIRSDGTPVSHAGVYLRDESAVNHSIIESEPYQLVTDKEGNFEFTSVIPGSYQLYLGLDFAQIDGWTFPVQPNDWLEVDGQTTEHVEVTLHPLLELHSPVNQAEITNDTMEFSWEEVEGVAYYNLSLGIEIEGGSISSSFKSQIKDNQLTIPIEVLYDKTVGMTFEDSEEWMSVDPLSILAFTNTENRFFWSVQAFDEHGEMTTQSNGYRLDEESIGNLPFFYLKEREMTEADRLFLDKNVEQAFEKYQLDYKKNPQDRHSLRMIVRLMGIEAAQTGKTRDEAAMPYLIQWAELSQSSEAAYDLAQIYYDKRDWGNYQRWYEKHLELTDGQPSGYVLSVHATALMKQREITEAQETFKLAMELDNSNRFIGNWLATELSANQSFDSVLALAKQYPERDAGGENQDWARLIQKMAEEEKGSKNYRQELNQGLELYFNDQQNELGPWLETSDDEQLVQFFKALQKVD